MNFTLTFDDGPSEWTPAILDLLAEHDRRAVFFVLGQYVPANREVLRRIHADGHEVGVHGWSHTRLTLLNDDEVRAELRQTQVEIRSVLPGFFPSRFRAPFFGVDERVLEIAVELGLVEHVGADVVPNDWMSLDAEVLAGCVLGLLGEGSVVSLHDGVPPDGGSALCTDSRLVTVEAVRLILEATA